MLTYENVAWYDSGKVRILDRRCYPQRVQSVECCTYQEVAMAIADMVTQSAGPYTAAGMGMALAAFIGRRFNLFDDEEFENGKAAAAMGLVGISEGAIPFAARDPLS
ncbi:MAG: S-methyl-5-thioribose-1-phosphate isomerase, partial [Oscillospiraceae bacterium]